jgi:hypothetical protein
MKKIGLVLLGLGAIVLLYGLLMDTSVQTSVGRVHNIGLMQERTMTVLVAGLLLVLGTILTVLGQRRSDPSPTARGASNSAGRAAPPDRFDGSADVFDQSYQLFLVKRFGIEKNNTLDKFVIGNEVFADLPSALAVADARYRQQIAEASATGLASVGGVGESGHTAGARFPSFEGPSAPRFLNTIRSWFVVGKEPIGRRLRTGLTVGFGVGLLLWIPGGSSDAALAVLVTVALALRAAPERLVRLQLHCASSVIWALVLARFAVAAMQADQPGWDIYMACLAGVPLALSLAAIFLLRKKATAPAA